MRVSHANGKSIEVGDVQELENVDNTVKNRLTGLSIEASCDTRKVSLAFSEEEKGGVIGLNVSGASVREAQGIFAAVEEQVDRTMMTGWVQKHLMASVLLVLGALVVGSMILIPSRSITKFVERDFLSSEEAALLRDTGDSLQTLDEKVDFLVEVRRRQLGNLDSPPVVKISPQRVTRMHFLKALPLLFAYGIVFYLAVACYPKVVFKWGDMGERYEHIVGRRKGLWNLVIGGVIVGALVSISVEAWWRDER